MINKTKLLQQIIAQLNHDLTVLFTAAKTAHAAATHEENAPDNKYDTLALEASYVAQGQANRASEIRQAVEVYKQMQVPENDHDEIRLASLVALETDDGGTKTVFIGPLEGGLRVVAGCGEVVVITPGSPLGRELLGKSIGDQVTVGSGSNRASYEIVAVD